ncbi:CU044_2847 family protein [Actinoplanes sp. L3-i22]|uniref:CU044_2847 family protein n=1 Tax=Actinoplanes sp. L3-i22 TaxID=2836373 RepID=UPI001C75EDCE|nr:CU044_2847 family protein [Actinoplanes sp. L3-i22]BCY13468.1 hypothetical protein L3i22_085560 [Actinoplanes sp. L3-i22]
MATLVPVTFAGVELMVQATPVTVVGSEPTSATSRVTDAYERAEAAVMGIAESVGGTIGRLIEAGKHPKEVKVEFGLSVSLEGTVLVTKGKAGATLAISLTYEIAG